MTLLFIQTIACVTFGTSFLQKIIGQRDFSTALVAFGVPNRLRREGALFITSLEILTAVLVLTSGKSLVAGFTIAAVLLAAFTIAVTRVIRSGAQVDCHCFGTSGLAVSWLDVVRNVGLLAMVAAGWALTVSSIGGTQSGQSFGKAIATPDGSNLAIAASAIGFALIWSHLPELARLARAS